MVKGSNVEEVDGRALGLNSLMEPQFIYSIYLLNVYYVSGTLTETGYLAVNKSMSLLRGA